MSFTKLQYLDASQSNESTCLDDGELLDAAWSISDFFIQSYSDPQNRARICRWIEMDKRA